MHSLKISIIDHIRIPVVGSPELGHLKFNWPGEIKE